jgi:hypothetical protein
MTGLDLAGAEGLSHAFEPCLNFKIYTLADSLIVAKSLDKYCLAYTLDLDLRPLTNELGGRLDYGQPFCIFHASCRRSSKALTAFLSLQARSSLSPQRCSMLIAALRSACVL